MASLLVTFVPCSARSAIILALAGKYLGGLAPLPAPRLGAIVIRDAVRRAGIDAAAVEEVIMGNVLQGGVGQAPARQAAIHAGLPGTLPSCSRGTDGSCSSTSSARRWTRAVPALAMWISASSPNRPCPSTS